MKRFLKYGFILILLLLLVGLIWYVIVKPKESVLKKIPYTVDYCFALNIKELIKESSSFHTMKEDSSYRLFLAKFPQQPKSLFTEAGVNVLGNMIIYGNSDTVNIAWIGKDEEKFRSLITLNKWKETVYETHSEIKISKNYYLYYHWPLMLLKNKQTGADEPFFNSNIKRLDPDSLNHTNTSECVIYGRVNEGVFGRKLKFLPRKGTLYAGIALKDKDLEVYVVQPDLKLSGNLGQPQKLPIGNAFFSWPLSLHDFTELNLVPATVRENLHNIMAKPVNHFYAEVLDTFSFSERIITYDMDAEFKLTQKITYVYKSYPGILLQALKVHPDSGRSAGYRPADLGLESIHALQKENPNSYVISSDTVESERSLSKNGFQTLPDYYIYANLEHLKTDPFWKFYLETKYDNLTLFATALNKGSMFTLKLGKK